MAWHSEYTFSHCQTGVLHLFDFDIFFFCVFSVFKVSFTKDLDWSVKLDCDDESVMAQ